MDSLMPPAQWGSSIRSPTQTGHSISNRRSTASLRNPEPLDNGKGGGGGQVSLAHELAAAMMPEPNITSKQLSEEFGIEFDDGADEEEEGMGGESLARFDDAGGAYGQFHQQQDPSFSSDLTPSTSAEDLRIALNGTAPHIAQDDDDDGFNTTFGVSPSEAASFGLVIPEPPKPKAKDPLELLAQNLEATDVFIAQLKRIDGESSRSGALPILEQRATTLVGRLNDVYRERETQVRSLQELERELRKISGEVGGNDILSGLDAVEWEEDLLDSSEKAQVAGDEDFRTPKGPRGAPAAGDTTPLMGRQRRLNSIEEDDDPDLQRYYGDDTDEPYEDDLPSPSIHKSSLSPAPKIPAVPTPSLTLPHLSYFRSLTASLASSLTSLSEHAQVNGVKTTDAGRKLRALKNKVGELKADWDSADRSRLKIERWEAGLMDDLTATTPELSSEDEESSREPSPGPDTPELGEERRRVVTGPGRIDGRKLVAEQLRGFEDALAEAARKTQAIMASA